MYHAIVRRRIEGLFHAVNQGDAEPVLRQFAEQFEHSFLGNSALGGSRTTLPGPANGTNGSIGFCPTFTSI